MTTRIHSPGRRFLPILCCMLLMLALLATGNVESSISAQAVDGSYLIKYAPQAKAAVVQDVRAAGGEVRFEFDSIRVLAVRLPETQVALLAQHPAVVSLTVDAKYELFDETVPYGIDLVKARDTWDANRDDVLDLGAPTGRGIRVCIVDTGIYAAHEDLGGGGVRIDGGRSWVGEAWDRDMHGHGTHVAGTVAAQHNNVGVVGVSPGDVELLIADVFNDAGESQESSVILDAVYWCADQGADIISMSLGGPLADDADPFGEAYAEIYNRGVLIVAAAGNDGGPVENYPASHPSVVSVAAVDSSGTVADFSNFVPDVEVAAPGVDVLSAWPVVNNVVVSGGPTYMANPVEFAGDPGAYSGPLADGGTCETPPAPGQYEGAVVLCQRANLPFKTKIDNAAAGGAAGVILYNNVEGNFSGTYGACCSTIPALSLSMADGEAIKASHLDKTVTLNIHQATTSGYASISGTSMATPHVSGVAAVIWSACPALTKDQVRSHMAYFTFEPEADLLDGRDIFYGYGIVDLQAAVEGLSDGIDDYDWSMPNSDGSQALNVECPPVFLPLVAR